VRDQRGDRREHDGVADNADVADLHVGGDHSQKAGQAEDAREDQADADRALDACPHKHLLGLQGASLEQGLAALSNVQLHASPGTAYEYANANYMLLGMVVEAVTQERFALYVQEHILQPLAMSHTQLESGSAVGYRYWFGVPVPEPMAFTSDFASVPTGGVVSTAEDMSHYLAMYLNNGEYAGTRIVSATAIAEMQPGRRPARLRGSRGGLRDRRRLSLGQRQARALRRHLAVQDRCAFDRFCAFLIERSLYCCSQHCCEQEHVGTLAWVDSSAGRVSVTFLANSEPTALCRWRGHGAVSYDSLRQPCVQNAA
jgi:hypothetical protein